MPVTKTSSRNRTTVSKSQPGAMTPAIILSVSLQGVDTVRLTFDGPVFPNKTPNYAAGAETAASVSVFSATEIDVTFTGGVAGATLVVGQNDPGVRTQFGGFVPAGNYTIPLT